MPTATATQELVSNGGASVLSLKPSKASSNVAESSTAATLRSLYSRAAKAFLHRDFALTHSLLTSAFGIISPANQYNGGRDCRVSKEVGHSADYSRNNRVLLSPDLRRTRRLPACVARKSAAVTTVPRNVTSHALVTTLHAFQPAS